MASASVAAVQRVHEEWARGNMRAGPELYDPAIVFITFAPEGDELVYEGLEGVSEWTRDFLAQWRNYRIEAEDFIESGDKVLVVGRHAGEGQTSGVASGMPLYSVWTFEDDRVVQLQFTPDRDRAFEAAGVANRAQAQRDKN
jgi:ketosteroid isomerase-like protein